MLPKTLFTVVGANQSTDGLEKSVATAAEAGASLSVAVVGIAFPPPSAIYNAVPLEAWTEEREQVLRSVRDKGEEVSSLLVRSTISGDVSLHYCDEAQIEHVVGRRGRFADLAIGFRDDEATGTLWKRAVSGLLFRSARPFLLVPDGGNATLVPENVMIAWNSTKEAARSVYCAIDMLTAAKSVRIVLVDPIAKEDADGEEPGNDIATYLAHHGVNVSVDILPAAGRDIASVLLTHANDVDADLVLMGAYGHSRLFEQVFGGTTATVLDSADRPVLMAH